MKRDSSRVHEITERSVRSVQKLIFAGQPCPICFCNRD